MFFMEDTDSKVKQSAVDGKSAYAGNVSAEMNDEVGIDQLGENAGLDIQPETPLAIKESLDARDKNRSELIPNADDFSPEADPAIDLTSDRT
ncbi:MAG: DUF6335 family protein [Phormidesmis sp.]